MPASSRISSRAIPLLVYTFAFAAAILWLVPLFASHPLLFPAGPSFEDILVYKGRFTLYHTAKFFTSRAFSGFAYPAGAAPIYEAFYKTSNAVATYLLLAGAASLIAILATFFFLRKRDLSKYFFPLLLFTFPLIFLIQRANIEIVLWIVIAFGILAYRRGLAIIAAILFGIAAAVKLYPIILLGLFLRRKQDIPAFVVGLVAAIATMYAALAHAGPTVAIAANGFFRGVDHFQDHYVDTVSNVEVAFDHCLFSPVKYWTYIHHQSPAVYTRIYYVLAATIALALFVRVRTLPFLNRVVFLTAAMVCLPPVSFSYTLVHLYVPLILLMAALATYRTRPPATAITALALLLFLMLPIMSISIAAPLPTGPIQSTALFLLLVITAVNPWQEATVARA